MQKGFEAILNEKVSSDPEESHIAALTAGDRDAWAQARRAYFTSGINQLSLHTIEKAAFAVILDEHEVCYDSVCFLVLLIDPCDNKALKTSSVYLSWNY